MSNDRQVLEAAKVNPTTISFIENAEGQVDWKRIIENGLAMEVDRIKKAQDFKRYQESFKQTQVASRPPRIKPLIKQALEVEGVGTWNELVEYCAEAGHTINVASPNDIPLHQPFVRERAWLAARTNNQYTLDLKGNIIRY